MSPLDHDSVEELVKSVTESTEPDIKASSEESVHLAKVSELPRVSRKSHGGATDPTSAIQQANTQRRHAALDLRAQGYSYRQIAEALGYSSADTARESVLRGLDRLVIEPGKEVIGLELYRLDSLMSAMMPLAMEGNFKAVDRVLKIMDRRAGYLGLNAPKATDIRVTVGDEARQLAQKHGIEEDLLNEIIIETEGVIKDEVEGR